MSRKGGTDDLGDSDSVIRYFDPLVQMLELRSNLRVARERTESSFFGRKKDKRRLPETVIIMMDGIHQRATKIVNKLSMSLELFRVFNVSLLTRSIL